MFGRTEDWRLLDEARGRQPAWLREAEEILQSDLALRRLGAYRLQGELGRGGMGPVTNEVYGRRGSQPA